MNKMNDYLTRFQKSKAKDYVTILLVFILGFAAAYLTATKNHDLSFPPIRSNSDQYDYSNVAYTFMKADIIGRYFTDEYKEPFITFMAKNKEPLSSGEITALNRVLDTKNYEKPVPYTYRPWLYPALIGTMYKIFGYHFAVVRIVNIILFALSAVLLFIIAYRIHNYLSGILAAALFILLPNVRSYTEFMLIEVTAVFMVLAVVLVIMYTLRERENNARYYLLGLALGILIITKHVFLFIIPFIVLPIGVYLLWRYSKRTIISGLLLLAGILFFVFPWMMWNVGVTGTTELLTGTQGYISIASVYTKEYYEGKSMYPIRDRLFDEYIKKHRIERPKNDIETALIGKEIFRELISQPEIQKIIPILILKKIKWSLIPVSKVLLAFFVVGVLVFSKNVVTWPIVGVLVGNLFACGISFDEKGRLLVSSFPIIVLFASIGITLTVHYLDERIRRTAKKPEN
jgi:4-amino-4-deoxy-L-arabinose transferase-like glycosyltransferase